MTEFHESVGFMVDEYTVPLLGELKVGAPQVVKCLITDQAEVSLSLLLVAQTRQ